MKKLFYSLVGTCAIAQVSISNAALPITGRGEEGLKGGNTDTIDQSIITFIQYLATFLTLIAVVYAMWGGFTILTAAGDEEKVKKGRTVIFHAVLGIIVILLAYAIVNWVVQALTSGAL